jgi:hypothetical protein
MPKCLRLLTPLALAALLGPASALGEPVAAAPAPPPPIPLAKGSVVRVDLSRVPQRVGRRGQALCVASRVDATGNVQELECRQPVAFEIPFPGQPVVLLFQPTGAGGPTRLEYPREWDPRPRIFTAPADGTLSQPPAPQAPPGPVAPTPAILAEARKAGGIACGRCPGPTRYSLRDVTLEPAEAPGVDVPITIAPR